MKQFKKIITTVILCSQFLTQVWANEAVQTPCYINTVDVENSDFENGNWIIDAPYLLLVDKTTGEIYYKTGHGNAGHGSYVEMIDKVNTNVTDFFEFILNHGF